MFLALHRMLFVKLVPLDSGAPLKVVQENAGHSDVGTTMHYRHVAQTDRHEATRTLSLTELKRKTRQSKCQD